MAASNLLIPAAQYLRMSTENQQYSLQNQADAITKYASEHGFEIVKTYSDAAKSGLRLKNRTGLKQLLKDAVGGQINFRAVLVYDVSRWGRFQDADEAAHYEYLCKSSGIPVHYCAEQFPNDDSISGLILKSLKRMMAGEYSRELSVKVRAGQFRLAKLGYKMGGHTPFGFRRQLLDVNARPKQLLVYGERKNLANERVILVPGPAEEVAIVQRMFREFAYQHKGPTEIARSLNRDGIQFVTGGKWTVCTVTNVLKNPKYLGTQMWGRTTAYLSGPSTRLPQDLWAICPNAFKPIISPELFAHAQATFANFTHNLSNEQMLQRLRTVLKRHGRLTTAIIEKSRSCPGVSTYRTHFGGLLDAYRQLGYSTPELCAQATLRQRTLLLRSSLIKSLVESFPSQIEEVRKSKRFRALLRYRRTGLLIAVVLAHHCKHHGTSGWRIQAPKAEQRRTTLVAFLNDGNSAIESLRVFPRLRFPRLTVHPGTAEEWLRSGQQVQNVSDFLSILRSVRSRRSLRPKSPNRRVEIGEAV